VKETMPRSDSKERKAPKPVIVSKDTSKTPIPTKERHRQSRRVECVAFATLLLSIVIIFIRLRQNRINLPHELRTNPITTAQENPHFHIVHVVIDDLGWNDVSWRKDPLTNSHHIATPHMNELKQQGILLDQFYTPKDCAPSRASMMTGRWPFQVGYYGNPGDDGGVPEHFEFLPQMLYRRYGFLCHHIGKWHLGFRKDVWTPTERGFLTSVGFYHWGEDYESHLFPPDYAVGRDQGCRGYDMVNATSGLYHRLNPHIRAPSDAKKLSSGGSLLPIGRQTANIPSARLYAREIDLRLANHPSDKPLYLNLAPQHVHDPYGDGTERTMGQRRELYETLVHEVDDLVAHLVGSLTRHSLWNNTLMLIHTDNGGELLFADSCAASEGKGDVDVGQGFMGGAADNGPLRGGKFTLWQGGIRGVAVLTGGAIPENVRGTVFSGLTHVVDCWASFAFLAHGLGRLPHHKHISGRFDFELNETFHHSSSRTQSSGLDSTASLAAAIFSSTYNSKHASAEDLLDDVSGDVLEWLGMDNAFQGDSHLEAIMSVPLTRHEIVLQPINTFSTGECSPSAEKSPFRPSCASGIIRWPYKLLVGFPGDARHVKWITSNSSTSNPQLIPSPTCKVSNPNKEPLQDTTFGLDVCTLHQPCLFNLEQDPHELDNLLNGQKDGHVVMQANNVPTTQFDALHRSLFQRLLELSKNGPPPVSTEGDGDKFPVLACVQVRETGSWLPWEYQKEQKDATTSIGL